MKSRHESIFIDNLTQEEFDNVNKNAFKEWYWMLISTSTSNKNNN